jgi:tellurite resistance protein TerC
VNVSYWTWGITLVVLVAILLGDLLIIGRRPHEPRIRESVAWVGFYVGLALAFGLWIWAWYGATYAAEFYTGWLTEYSLSIDNLFVFVIIMSRFVVPRAYQQKVLLVGIILALVMRGVFIAAGGILVSRFVWVFYLFGAFLVYTAVKLARHRQGEQEQFQENIVIRWSRRAFPMSPGYDRTRLTTVVDGRRVVTPMLIVMIAIGSTDLVFAVDSIPAIFGITKEPYLVFTANVFALMGLRQLYFLIGGLLDRLIYLNVGLAVVLGFVGVKMMVEALADNNLPFVNGGQPFTWAPHVPIWLSLAVIVVTLAGATAASMIKTSRDRRRATALPTTPAPPA